MRSSVWTLSLPLSLLLTACPATLPGGPSAKNCPEEPTPNAIDPTRVQWRLTFEAEDGRPALRPLTAEGAAGLGVERRFGEGEDGRTFLFEPLSLFGVQTSDRPAIDAWAAEIAAFGARCVTIEPHACDREWSVAELTRTVVLEALDDQGTVLASWRVTGVFPTSLGSGRNESELTFLMLSLEEADFSYGEAGFIREAFGGNTVPSTSVPAAPEFENPEENAAYLDAIERFVALYRSPHQSLLLLNALRTASQSRAEAASALPRFAERSGNFKIEIEGVIQGGFKEISGLESEVEVIEFKQGNDKVVRKKPGRTTYANITLKSGQATDHSLLEWYKKVLSGQTDRKSGSIIYIGRDGQELMRYNLFEAWPSRWTIPDLDSDQSGLAVEKIEIAVEKIERA